MIASIDELAVCIQAKVDKGELGFVETSVSHYHTKDLYGRRVVVPTGTFFTTAVHKVDHISTALRGRITILNADGTSQEVVAPDVFVTLAGTHRVVYVHEEVEFLTVHHCEEQDNNKVADALTYKTMLEFQHNDYLKFISETGLSEAEVHELVENLEDQVPMPTNETLTYVAPSAIDGNGVFAAADIEAGARIAPGRIGIYRTPVGRYTNHSSSPNTYYALSGDNIDMYALKNIYEDEELTVDYRQANQIRLKAAV